MPGGTQGLDVRSIQTLFGVGSVAGLTDGQLLEHFVDRKNEGSEAAFAALVALHSAMVWKVCRQILPNSSDAEDAFQATFLLLVRKAGSIRRREALGSWLYGVARRVAVRAKADAARRRLHESQITSGSETSMPDRSHPEELAALHEEVDGLPEKYRLAVLLCHLEGRTHSEAASLLGCPTATISIRLSRARELLRERLTRRGVSLSSVVALVLGPLSASHAITVGLVESTTKAVTKYIAAGKTITTGILPAEITQLTEGVLRTMTIKKSVIATTFLLLSGLAVSGIGWLAIKAATSDINPGAEAATQRDPAGPTKDEPATAKAQNGNDEAKARRLSLYRLRTIALAMNQFAAANSTPQKGSRFPAAAIYRDGKPLLSWRVAILPYLGMNDLYEKFDLDRSWNSPDNIALLGQIPDVYAPVVPKGEAKGSTHYQVFVGPGALFNGLEGPGYDTITDAKSGTALVVEARKPVPWTKPEDVRLDEDEMLPKLGGQFDEGFHIVFVDGSARLLSKPITEHALHDLITPSTKKAISKAGRPPASPTKNKD